MNEYRYLLISICNGHRHRHIGAKVKQLIDQRISADVRRMMQPVSILDEDFEEKVAHLPHAEARASVMEHAIRARIHERLEQNKG